MAAEKLGPIGEALLAGKIRAQARRLRELEAGKATAAPPDPLAALERREKARAERHMGSVVRRLHRQGHTDRETKVTRRLSERQLNALEVWAADHAAATVGARSQLGRDEFAGVPAAGDVPERDSGRALALSRFNVARAAVYVGAGWLGGRVTEAVACANLSLTAAVTSATGIGRAIDAGEAFDLLTAGADALEAHYRGRGGR